MIQSNTKAAAALVGLLAAAGAHAMPQMPYTFVPTTTDVRTIVGNVNPSAAYIQAYLGPKCQSGTTRPAGSHGTCWISYTQVGTNQFGQSQLRVQWGAWAQQF